MIATKEFKSWWATNKDSSSLYEEYLNYLHETKMMALGWKPMSFRSWGKRYFTEYQQNA